MSTPNDFEQCSCPPLTIDDLQAMAAASQHQQEHGPLRQRLPAPSSDAVNVKSTVFDPGPSQVHTQMQAPLERWEQVPIGIRLMNEICDAITSGSDFAFWSGLVIIVVILIGLIVWLSE